MAKLTVTDLENIAGSRVLVRVDFNVPLDKDGRITDDTRIRAALPTITYLRERQARIILASHLGRPKGLPDPRFSLRPVADRLKELLAAPVELAVDCVGEDVQAAAKALRPGNVLLLENVRFHPEEEANDSSFARELAALADIYVNDAFGAAHRAHASTEGVAHYLPAAAGFLLAREIEVLGRVMESPERPFVAIIGGAKVSDKIGVIRNLLPRVDNLLIGGGMANTFFKAKGLETGRSLVEENKLDLARELLQEAAVHRLNLVLPVDAVVAGATTGEAAGQATIVPVEKIPPDKMALDIGPGTVEEFGRVVAGARTVVWNGPLGVFEVDKFAKGTLALARAVAACPGTTIVGGGDSAAALELAGVADKITHISTGGGASLEFLGGRKLPGVEALNDKPV